MGQVGSVVGGVVAERIDVVGGGAVREGPGGGEIVAKGEGARSGGVDKGKQAVEGLSAVSERVGAGVLGEEGKDIIGDVGGVRGGMSEEKWGGEMAPEGMLAFYILGV